jgi:hypothetical protein
LKKVSIFIGIVVVLVGVAFYFLQPKAIVENPELLNIYRVVSYSNSEGTEITESVDLEKLSDILSRYQHGGIPKSFAPYSLSEIRYEINGTYGRFDSLHILVGDLNIVYESSEHGFEIGNSHMLLTEIDTLINP